MQSFLKIVQSEVLDHFGIKYLTMTGAMSAKERVEIADQFNSNQQIKCLLLTS
jgi:SNF2 family DNA or RNA helicase